MAIYHLSVRPVQRSRGQSAVAAAAYRSGTRLRCQRTGLLHTFSTRSGIKRAELIGWRGSRAELWSQAELVENRADATVAREFQAALPEELNTVERLALGRLFAHWLRARYGVAVDLSFHDFSSHNPHIHCLCTTRAVSEERFGSKAPMEWDGSTRRRRGWKGRRAELQHARHVWSDVVNSALANAGHRARVDHRSYEEQYAGYRHVPMPTVYLGPAARRLEASGVPTLAGEINRLVGELRDVEEELAWVQAQLPPRRMWAHPAPGAILVGMQRLTPVTTVTEVDQSPALAVPSEGQPDQEADREVYGRTHEDEPAAITERDVWLDEVEPDTFEPDDDATDAGDEVPDDDEPLTPG